MPLHLHKKTEELTLAFWHITETMAYFLERTHFINTENLQRFTHPQAKLQWLASRLLLFEVLGFENYSLLEKDGSGKPVAKNGSFELSISHSDDMVSIAIAQKPIGIDIQRITKKLERIAGKFIQKKELDAIQVMPAFGLETIHVHWGIKEALFKADGRGQLDFKKQLHLDFDKGYVPQGDSFDAFILKNDKKEFYSAHYETIFEEYIFCIVTKKEFQHSTWGNK